MFRIDDPSASSTLPVPETAGTPGYFTEGIPGSKAATLVRAAWLNMLQEEFINIVVAGGLTPSKTTYNQILLAIEALNQQTITNFLATQNIFTLPQSVAAAIAPGHAVNYGQTETRYAKLSGANFTGPIFGDTNVKLWMGGNIANMGVGAGTLTSNTSGLNLTAAGTNALNSNTTGSGSSAFGASALTAVSTGTGNVGLGVLAGADDTTGSNNTFLGTNTGRGIVSGSGNSIFGQGVAGLPPGLTNNIIIANGAGIQAQFDGTNWTLQGPITRLSGAAFSSYAVVTADGQIGPSTAGLHVQTSSVTAGNAMISLTASGDEDIMLTKIRGTLGLSLFNGTGALSNLSLAAATASTHAVTLGQLNAKVSATAGAVGTYVLAAAGTNTVYFGGTIAGSAIQPAGNTVGGNGQLYPNTQTYALAGTWQCMGTLGCYSGIASSNTIFMRIA